jgi:hypothetical protein
MLVVLFFPAYWPRSLPPVTWIWLELRSLAAHDEAKWCLVQGSLLWHSPCEERSETVSA